MTVDNELYNRLSSTWWDENEPLNLLRTSINPGRFGYFRDVLIKQLKIDPRGKKTLDVGCGGGILAEEFARLGCHVIGIDPSAASLATARAHAQQAGLDIDVLRRCAGLSLLVHFPQICLFIYDSNTSPPPKILLMASIGSWRSLDCDFLAFAFNTLVLNRLLSTTQSTRRLTPNKASKELAIC